MVSGSRQRAAHRSLDRHGREMTHVSFSQTGTDDYGDSGWSETTETIVGRLNTSRAPWQERAEGDTAAHQKASIIVKDSVDVTDETGPGRPDEFRIDYDGDGTVDDTYKVAYAEHQDGGLIACEVRLID